ncbi:MAG: class I SAM-dependent rRNA methyltransferase [Bdellovibrionales bacterium]|nr:class I SAM-dependent rRNA methyltransferase [Bdellovibrionales bacterium]
MIKAQLNKNIRKIILQGHPWVYRDALADSKLSKKTELCKVIDPKGDFVAWAIYQPQGALALRILSLDKNPPNEGYYFNKMDDAHKRRRQLVMSDTTNCFRLFNGEGDNLPGVICDIYNYVAVMQFDGESPKEFWHHDLIANWILQNTSCNTVYLKSRGNDDAPPTTWGDPLLSETVQVLENNVAFDVNIAKGQKTGFFLDQRDNRQYVQTMVRGLSGLNLFSYTGGFSIYAGLGGAKEIISVDISKEALTTAEVNWRLNKVEESAHRTICADIYQYLSADNTKWDFVIVDPPSMAHSEAQKEVAIKKYVELFANAVKKVKPSGQLFLSSCTSHIAFDDFFEIINEALSKSRRRGLILRVSGQGPDHPFPHICHEFRYLKFVHLQLD